MAITYYSAGNYDNPIGPDGRARTIAAFHVAQVGDVLARVPMRRDVLEFLTSPSAIRYWLNQKGWLEKHGQRGGVGLLRLTAEGLTVCEASQIGRARTNTSPALVQAWRRRMVHGDAIAHIKREFSELVA